MPPVDVSGLLAVDFFTRGYRVSGHVNTRVRTVGDILDDRLLSYVELDDVYISRISDPGKIVAARSRALLHKDSLLFAIVPSKESLSKAGRSVSYFGKHAHRAWLALPTFEIEGDLRVASLGLDLRAFLIESVIDYVPILDGVARPSSWPDISFTGEAFLVNKKCIELFSLGDS